MKICGAVRSLPLLAILIPFPVSCANQGLEDRIDWEAFLGRHDLLWDRLPTEWYEAPFLGNGMMGAMILRDSKKGLRLQIHRSDVQDHRDNSYGSTPYSRPRLPIGHFTLEPVGEITGANMHLDLWNAELRGELITDIGRIGFIAIVHSDEMTIMVQLNPSPGEEGCRWQWRPARAVSPRQAYGGWRLMRDYQPNPNHRMDQVDGVRMSVQPLLVGGETATAWSEELDDDKRTLYVTVAHSYPEKTAKQEAAATIQQVTASGFQELLASHRSWWHRYYPASFLSIPDTRLEGFYWIQMYKLASATRGDRALIDNHGPWLQKTPWPGAWWNLNVQLSYSPLYTSNRLELAESLGRTLDRNFQNLVNNVEPEYRRDSAGIGRVTTQDCIGRVGVPGRTDRGQFEVPEVGLLPWACHNYWLQYRYSMDDKLLRDRLLPLLRRSINYYLHFLDEDEEGKLHLPSTYSPEYGIAPDSNFDLALLRWGCAALIKASHRLGIEDPLLDTWRQTLEKLKEYAVDDRGLMIGRDVPLERSHRHYSHLLAIYPLYLLNWEQPANQALIEKSLNHWLSLDEAHQGYSFTGAASILASMGKGDEAYQYLKGLIEGTHPNYGDFIKPNTLYQEAGPVIETPLSAAQSLQEMLLQSWGGKIRVFPAVPDGWHDVVIHNLRAEGAFLVSAARRGGQTQFVRLLSLAGEPCRLRVDRGVDLRMATGKKIPLNPVGGGEWEIGLEKGEEIILYAGDEPPKLAIAPLSPNPDQLNFYGLH